MKLVFNRIKYQNLMSVGAKPTNISLDNFKKTLITGQNGGGKSTLLEALCFGLFGTPFRKIKKGQLVNSVNKKNCTVELWFSYGRDNYYIKRGIKPNVFEVEKNDVKWDEASSLGDFQVKLEEQLKISPIAFKQIVVLGTAGYVPFMELTTPNRRKLVEELLEVAVLGAMADLNKSELKGMIQEMNLIENSIDSLRRELEAHQSYIDKQKETESLHIDDIRQEFNSHITSIKEFRDQLSPIETEILTLTEQINQNLSNEITKYSLALQKLEDMLTEREIMLESFKSGKCPTCQQDFADHSKIEATKHNISSIISKKSEITEKLDKFRQDVVKSDAVIEKIKSLETKSNELKSKMSVHVQSAKSLKAKLNELENSVEVDLTKVNELKSKMSSLKDEKTVLFDKKYTRTIASDLLKDSGIKASIVKRYIPVFNKKINHYLKTMGADYTFTIDEEFNEVIKSKGREDFSYESFSQGERARIDLSLLFTWRDISSLVTGMEINLLILDEVFDSATDATGVKAITRILDSLDSNIVIISHREEHDKEAFGRWIHMSKKGRFSVMETKHVQESMASVS